MGQTENRGHALVIYNTWESLLHPQVLAEGSGIDRRKGPNLTQLMSPILRLIRRQACIGANWRFGTSWEE